MGVTQNITGLTHCGGYTLHLPLTFGISIENIATLPQSEMISDHNLILFELYLSHDIECTIVGYCIHLKNLPDLLTLIVSPSDSTELSVHVKVSCQLFALVYT